MAGADLFDFAKPAHHDIRISGGDERAALFAIADAMRASEAQIVKLSGGASGDGICAFMLRIAHADADQARAIADAITARASVSAQVEHIWWRSAP